NFNVFPHFQIMLRTIWLKLLRKKSYALFLTPHGGFNPEWSIFSFPVRFFKSFYHFTVGALLINLSVDGVRAVSEWERHEMLLKHLNPHLLKTISNGLEDEAYIDVDASASPDIKSQVALWGKYLIQIGRVYRIKNYETTLRALPLLPTDINYVIVGPVGDEQYKLKLLKLIDDLNIQNRVFFAGVIRGVDKYYVIRHSEMMVHMAVWESYCNVIHEAMSQGKVVLAADNTAMPLLIKNETNGFCLPTFDHRLLAKNIIKLLDPGSIDLKHRIESNNRRIGLNDSWNQVARRMSDFYLDNYSRVNPVQYLFAYAK
ncbi:MAG TPA: glycosyltransferase, partial [Patescibacteria group bacterium]